MSSAEAVLLLGALSADDRLSMLRLALHFARRPLALRIFLETLLMRVDHPLDPTFHSATPYLLGDRHSPDAPAVKYSVRPRLAGRKSFAPKGTDRGHPNFLAKALVESLHPAYGQPIELDFCLHVPKLKQLPVEDATANWTDAAIVPVATIRIEPQHFAHTENVARCERLAFSPWHALGVHQPLGSLNRARLGRTVGRRGVQK